MQKRWLNVAMGKLIIGVSIVVKLGHHPLIKIAYI
jgi:hypothetical protein